MATTSTSRSRTTPTSTSRTSRAIWVAAGSLLAVATLAYGTFTAVGLVAFDRDALALTFPADQPVVAIDANNRAGSLTVLGEDRDDVAVEADIVRGLFTPDHDIRVVDGTLQIDSSCPVLANTWCDMDVTVRLPAGVDVTADASGGSIRVEGVTGRLDLDASGGSVRVVDASGPLRLRASGGGIRGSGLRSATVDADSSGGGVRLMFVDEPTTVAASSSGGGVTIVLPETDAAYAVDADSSGGGVRTDVRTDPDSPRSVQADSSGGSVTIRYPEPT
jgi:hypothetical protein